MTGPKTPPRWAIVLAFTAIYLIWGSTYLGIRVAVETMPPFTMAAARFAVAGCLLFAILKVRGAAWPSRVQWRDQAVAGIFMLLGGNAVVSWAEQATPSGMTSLILGASPLAAVLLDWARPGGRMPGGVLLVGVAVGILGVAMLVGPGALPQGFRPPAGDILALVGASISWWIGSLYSKHSNSGAPLIVAASMQMLAGSGAMAVTGAVLGEWNRIHLSAVSPQSWAAFAYLVVAGSLVAFPVYVWLLDHCTPARVSTYAYVNPMVAVFLGWAILGEPMNPRIFVAAGVIVGAVAVITIGKTRRAQDS